MNAAAFRTTDTPGATPVRREPPYRMKDLCELTGLSRQAIHFYIQQGLVPEGQKTGRNMAWYGAEHLERLQVVRRLQHERFLPLKTIRALLDDETAGYAQSQRAMLLEVRSRLAESVGTRSDSPATVEVAAAAARHGVAEVDIHRMAARGMLAVIPGGDAAAANDDAAAPRLAEDMEWLVELWGQLRAAGFTESLGFTVDDLALYADAINGLVKQEAGMLKHRMSTLPPAQVAELVGRILPLIHTFLARFHTSLMRTFFSAIEGAPATPG
jgi:DNA-binding transcriptional MerR regulator